MSDWKKYKLIDVVEPVKEKVDTSFLDISSYISTENMLPNKSGVCLSSGIPTGSVIKFQPGDVLISNIRPYFRKIWIADKKGGCSTDVICLRATDKISSHFLFYLLSQNSFFSYVMQGAKGTKMPRGDRNQILQWPISLPPLFEQNRIVSILKSLDDKIEVNRRINENLEQQAQALFKSWFVDFEPFKGKPFVESELGMIPQGWRVGNLFDVSNILDKFRKPLSGRDRESMNKVYPYYGATSCMDYVDNYIFDGVYTLIGEDGSVAKENGLPYMQYVWGKLWVNNHAHILQGKNGFSTEMIHVMLSMTNIQSLITGAVQAKLSQTNMQKILVAIPPTEILNKFRPIIDSLYSNKRNMEDESRRLSELRDTLLPRLMSGELKVQNIDLINEMLAKGIR